MLGYDSDDESGGPWENYTNLKSLDNKQGVPVKVKHQRSFGWEIIEGLKDEEMLHCPASTQGIVYRKRKWPMKGWSRLHIVLENGVLAFSKAQNRILKRHFEGNIDLGLSIVSYKAKHQRIDIDAEKTFYHFKVKDPKEFDNLIYKIKAHRLYRQSMLKFNKEMKYTIDGVDHYDTEEEVDTLILDDKPLKTSIKNNDKFHPDHARRKKDSTSHVTELVRTMTLVEEEDESIIRNSTSFALIGEDFKLIQKKIKQIAKIFHEMTEQSKLDYHHLSYSNPALSKISNNSTPTEPTPPDISPRITSTGNNLLLAAPDNHQNTSITRFKNTAEEVFVILKTVFDKLIDERNNLKQSQNHLETKRESLTLSRLNSQIKELTQQNHELRTRLNTVKQVVNIPISATLGQQKPRTTGSAEDHMLDTEQNMKQSRHISVTDLFYDAAEYLESDSGSSISEEAEIYDNEISEAEDEVSYETEQIKKRTLTLYQQRTGRRDKLPCTQPDTSGFSLMNLLCKNIGRDLSKVRLPVMLSEPLGILQLLCEDLEYSDLLDSAAVLTDPIESMHHLMAFAISGYASTLCRVTTKPFNPVLGETFEYVREDKGWKFIAEQISHHPPVSVAHCESENWEWTQEFRLKNKFWGKSIEAIPTGRVLVKFKKSGETVQWNKVTTCIYNLFSESRYLEHYGDMNFICSNKAIDAKLTFHKSNWMHQKYELTGSVNYKPLRSGISNSANSSSQPVTTAPVISSARESKIFGKWTEAVYVGDIGRCIWRPGAMPEDYDKYYGFTKFARDLNNPEYSIILDSCPGVQSKSVIRTDSRMRPDQRALEEGILDLAEKEKARVEEKQRNRIQEIGGEENWRPLWFNKSEKHDYSTFNKRYWKESRTAANLPVLW